MIKTIDLLKGMADKVRIFRFRSAPEPKAIKIAYETVRMLDD